MGRPSAPVVDWPFTEKWQALTTWRNGRVAVGVLSWLVAFVIALFAQGSDAGTPISQSVRDVVVLATPVLLVVRPRLGCAVAVVSAALLGIAGEPPLVVVPFAVNAVFCAYFLARFLIGPLRQRRLFAQFAADKYRQQLACLPPWEVVYRSADAEAPDVHAAVAAIEQDPDNPPPDDLFPATVVGDFRVGGYVAVVTDHVLLLPGGPLRAWLDQPPIEVPPGLLDGRQWSGLTRPS